MKKTISDTTREENAVRNDPVPSDYFEGIPRPEISEGSASWKISGLTFDTCAMMHLEGASFPKKGLPTPEAVWSLNIVKKSLVETLKLLSSWQFLASVPLMVLFPSSFVRKAVSSFARIGEGAMGPYFVNRKYLTPSAKALYDASHMFLTMYGTECRDAAWASKTLAHIAEYDCAYRYRLQDLAAETSSDALAGKPIREILRLAKVLAKRDTNHFVKSNAKKAALILCLLLLNPKIRRAYRASVLSADIAAIDPDEGDRFWLCIREDYDHFGMPLAERKAMMGLLGWKEPVMVRPE